MVLKIMKQLNHFSKLIRLQHCDPAGVVFTPQYFNLLIEVVEDWFAKSIQLPIPVLLKDFKLATPILKLETRFLKVSYLGDTINFEVEILKLRSKSLELQIIGYVKKEKRLSCQILYGCASLEKVKLSAWPERIQKKLDRIYLEQNE
jgi:4-hydroxybenzoyl-CoA thioesterase